MSIFIDNKYTKWYFNIIHNAQNRILSESTYIEKHHIIPKSLGGSNLKGNIVRLLAREHLICHLLLVRMCLGSHKKSMIHAANMLCRAHNKNQERMPSKSYEIIRKMLSESMMGPNNPMWGKPAPNRGIKRSKEFCERMSIINRGKIGIPHTEEAKNKMRNFWLGKPKSLEARKKMSDAKKNAPKITCVHCSKEMNYLNHKKWHGEKCKLSPRHHS